MKDHITGVALVAALVCSAYAMTLARSSPEHSWLGWLALVPLFGAIRICPPLVAAVCGAVWGVSLYAFSLATIDRFPPPAEVGNSLALPTAAVLTAIPAMYALLGAALTRRIGFSPLVLGVGWMAVELAFEPLGLHEGLLGSSRGDWTLIDWIARAFGYVLVAFLVAYVNACLLAALARIPLRGSSRCVIPRENDDRLSFAPFTRVCSSLHPVPTIMPRAPPSRRVGR